MFRTSFLLYKNIRLISNFLFNFYNSDDDNILYLNRLLFLNLFDYYFINKSLIYPERLIQNINKLA
jgi:hypothetical protein